VLYFEVESWTFVIVFLYRTQRFVNRQQLRWSQVDHFMLHLWYHIVVSKITFLYVVLHAYVC